jgi:hypothetical protein
VTGVSAIISGTVNANGLRTWGYFRWGTTTVYDHSSFNIRFAPLEVPMTFSNLLTGLSTNTTYHYQLIATNTAGQTLSPDMTLTTSAYVPMPVVTINPATNVTPNSATITGSVTPSGFPVSVSVGWVTGLSGTSEWVEALPAQNAPVPVSITLSNLMSNTTYLCSLAADNAIGLGAYSAQISFTTLEAQTAITSPATDITATSATLYGTLNPNGFDTTYYFQWGTDMAYGNATPSFSVQGQNTPINGIAAGLTGLSPGTTYHYQFVATNSEGLHLGGDLPFTTLSTISIQGQVFNYSTNNGTVTIHGYAGPGGDLTIPGTIGALPVTAIADNVFFNVTNLTSVSFPETLRSLGDSAFEYCRGLTSITLPGSLTDLGVASFAACSGLVSATLPVGLRDLQNSVFQDCSSLTSITIPNSVTNIGAGAFSNCGSLTNLLIGNGVLNIGAGAFWQCTNLTTVAIPASTLSIATPDSAFSIDISPFADCTSLSAINVDPLNRAYSSVGGVLLNKDESKLLFCPQAKRGNYVIPDSVIVIVPSAFLNCSNLADITIGNNVAYISIWAFEGCSGLTRLTIPDSVTNIQDAPVGGFGNGVANGVFWGCASLTNVIIGKGLSYLGLGAFSGCSNLLSVYFKGNAPTPGSTPLGVYVFGADSPTVYYLPGTTGWGSTFAGRPTKIWNPQFQQLSFTSGPDQGRFGFTVTGTADIPLIIEAISNPSVTAWTALQTCTLTNGALDFTDPASAKYPARFYRICSP